MQRTRALLVSREDIRMVEARSSLRVANEGSDARATSRASPLNIGGHLAILSKAPRRSSLAKELSRGRRKHTQLRHQSKRVHDDAGVFDAALLQAVDDHAPNPDVTTGGGNAHKLSLLGPHPYLEPTRFANGRYPRGYKPSPQADVGRGSPVELGRIPVSRGPL
jgi:hypothetical protein